MKVIWRNIECLEGKLQINNNGVIRWLNKRGEYSYSTGTIHKSGYSYFRGKRVHRLVLEAFVGKSNLVIDHINGNRSDNRLENLEYVTQKENIKRGLIQNPAASRNRKPYKRKEIFGMKRNCDNPNCNKEYKVNPGNYQRGWSRCCSKSCATTMSRLKQKLK